MRWGWEQYGQLSSVLSFRAATSLSLRSISVTTGFPVTGQMNFSGGMATPFRLSAMAHGYNLATSSTTLNGAKILSDRAIAREHHDQAKLSQWGEVKDQLGVTVQRLIVTRGDRGSN